MTHNVGNGLARPRRLITVLRECGADLVGLQELAVQQERAIAQELQDVYPHQALFGGGIPGKGLLSKYPIMDTDQLHLYPARPDLRATVRIGSVVLSVIVAHPPPRNVRRGFIPEVAAAQQIERLVAQALAAAPSLLLGDFNITRRGRHYSNLLAAGLVDAFGVGGRGRGATLPARLMRVPFLPMARVDYIWHTPDIQTLNGWIGADSGSDHRPVLARLRVFSLLMT